MRPSQIAYMQFKVGIAYGAHEFLVVPQHGSCIFTYSFCFVPKTWIFVLQLELIFRICFVTKCGA